MQASQVEVQVGLKPVGSNTGSSHFIASARDCCEAIEFLFWAWGQDLQQRKRETFLSYGFTRYHNSKLTGAKSMYCKSDDKGGFVCLWAFGILSALPGESAVFFKRGEARLWALSILHPPTTHLSLADLESARTEYLPSSRLAPLAQSMVAFVIQYEKWIESRFGRELREKCFKKWKEQGPHQRLKDFNSMERSLLDLQEWSSRNQTNQSRESTIPLEC